MSNLTIKVDDSLRKEAEELYKSFGLSLSAAIKMFLTQSVREQAIPFQARKTAEEKYDAYFNPVNMQRLQQSIAQAQAGQVVYKTIEELEAYE